MPQENSSPPLSIQKTYTSLESIDIPKNIYVAKYKYLDIDKEKISLENSEQFLKDITTELKTFESTNPTLSKECIAALFKLETNHVALTSLVGTLVSKEVTLQLLYYQLAEFIDLSRLAHFISITPRGYFDSAFYLKLVFANKNQLELFAVLTRLKFQVFQANLFSFLKTSQETSDALDKIVFTLTNDYLPKVARASYSTALLIILSNYGTNNKAIQKIILDKEIPSLKKAFENYKEKTTLKKSEISQQSLDDSDNEAEYRFHPYNNGYCESISDSVDKSTDETDSLIYYSCDEGCCESIPDSEDENDEINKAPSQQNTASSKKSASLLDWLKSLYVIKYLIKLFKKSENHAARIYPENTMANHSDAAPSIPVSHSNAVPAHPNDTTCTLVNNTSPNWRKKQVPNMPNPNYSSNRYCLYSQPTTHKPVMPSHWRIYMRFI